MAVKENPAAEDQSEGLAGLKSTPDEKPSPASLSAARHWISSEDAEEMKEVMQQNVIKKTSVTPTRDSSARNRKLEVPGITARMMKTVLPIGPPASVPLLPSHT